MHAQLQRQQRLRRADLIEDLLNGQVQTREGLKVAQRRIMELRKD